MSIIQHLEKRLEAVDRAVDILFILRKDKLNHLNIRRYKLNPEKCVKYRGKDFSEIIEKLIELSEILGEELEGLQ